MLKRTEKFNSKGRRLYLDTNTGKESTLYRIRGKKTGFIPTDVLHRFLTPKFNQYSRMLRMKTQHLI